MRRHAPPQWFGPGGFRRPLLDANRLPVRFRGPGLRRPGEIDRAPANLYNRPENRPRVDLAALRGPAHPLWRPGGEPTRLPNDVFAGKDGKVYQRDAGGGWRVNEGRTWKPAQLPVAPNPPGSAGSPPSGSRQLPPTEERPLGRLKPRPMPAPAQLPASAPVSPPMREPARREWPPQRPPQPRTAPAPRPEPPRVSPVPGNLEREFHARERARPEPAATPPQKRQGPPRKDTPKPKGEGGGKEHH